MADFFLTASTNVAQTLTFADSGVVAQGVTLFTAGATSAVSMTSSARLTALGAIVTENANTLSITNTLAATVNLGQSGSMISMLNAAISGEVNDQFFLNNAGLIQGFAEAIRLNALVSLDVVADYHLVNSGTIQSNGDTASENTIEILTPSDALVTFGNSGTILNGGVAGGIFIGGASLDFTNSGTLQVRNGAAAVTSGNGADDITNTGTIIGSVLMGAGSDELANRGTITGNVDLNDGSDRVVNHGTIDGSVSTLDFSTVAANADAVVNSGLISGDVNLGEGADIFISLGGQVMGLVNGGGGDDTYVIDGAINIFDATGFDTVQSSVNFVMPLGIERLFLTGSVGLTGAGNAKNNLIFGTSFGDTLIGGAGDDELRSSSGNNTIHGGRGNDLIFAEGENDTTSAGAGNDVINLGAGNHTVQGGSGVDRLDLADMGEALDINLTTGLGKIGADLVLSLAGIEDLLGDDQADILVGTTGANLLQGRAGNDTIRAGSANDTLLGGEGADMLAGGFGTDRFVYAQLTDSGPGSADTITDFSTAQDVIDLFSIDGVAGDDLSGFTFIGNAAFTGTKAEVRFFNDAGSSTTVIELRTSGAAANDMVIILNGMLALTADNFLL